jgi:hypothetical protein
MHRLLTRQPPVPGQDPLGPFGHGRIAVDSPLRELVGIGDPDVRWLGPSCRKVGHAVEHDQPRYLVRKSPSIGQADHASYRMVYDRDLPKACGLHQACQIVNVIGQAAAAVRGLELIA